MGDHQDDQQEHMLPIANVGRLMKQSLPAMAKISKEAKQTMQECATEFISFVTGEASDRCHKENRKTVNGDDICWALTTLGFDNYAEPMLRYLHKYREAERDKSSQINNGNYIINNNNNNNSSPNSTDYNKAHIQVYKDMINEDDRLLGFPNKDEKRAEISAVEFKISIDHGRGDHH